MTTDITEVDDHSPVHPGEQHSHGPTDGQYFTIFWVLVVLTALEVSTEWWTDWFGEGSRKIAVPVLLILMVIKFFLVALYFMHLKFDSALLKRSFYFGMILAIAVYGIAADGDELLGGLREHPVQQPPARAAAAVLPDLADARRLPGLTRTHDDRLRLSELDTSHRGLAPGRRPHRPRRLRSTGDPTEGDRRRRTADHLAPEGVVLVRRVRVLDRRGLPDARHRGAAPVLGAHAAALAAHGRLPAGHAARHADLARPPDHR